MAQPIKVLVVDDSAMVRKVLTTILSTTHRVSPGAYTETVVAFVIT